MLLPGVYNVIRLVHVKQLTKSKETTDHVKGWEGNSRELTTGSGWEMRGGYLPEEVTFQAEHEGGRRSNEVDGAGGTLWAEGTLHAQLCG